MYIVKHSAENSFDGAKVSSLCEHIELSISITADTDYVCFLNGLDVIIFFNYSFRKN